MNGEMLIFGGTGFIGRHLCCYIEKIGRGATVISRAPDRNFLSRYAPSIDSLTVDEFLRSPSKWLQSASSLVYLASTSVPVTNKDMPWVELSNNVEPAFNLFYRAVRENPDIRVVYLSSGGTVYGNGYDSPIPEFFPLKPISPYGYGKQVTEECVRYLGRTEGLNYAILRVSNPIGLWNSNPQQGIISVAFQAVLNNQPISLYGGGNQVRDFLDADDLSECIVSSVDAAGFSQVVWNVGSGLGYKIIDVIDLVEAVVGQKLKKRFVEARTVDAAYSVLDSSLVYRDLGWCARTSLHESISKIWDFVRR